jgi:hypothetical protein
MGDDNDIVRFLKNLLDPDMYGYAVSQEVRDEAKKLLNNYFKTEGETLCQ